MKSLTLSVPNDFWKEEERCDYKVSKEMKQIWAVELDLLHMFDTVCKKHQLRYFASDGTLLGAIRHHGFIPWDDDIDIAMLREDYDKLCKIGPAEFKHPYFFQTEYTDPGSFRFHAQLRNSETTAILANELHGKFSFNQGVFLDIFVFDNVPDSEALFVTQKKRAEVMKSRASFFVFWGKRFVLQGRNFKYKLELLIHCVFGRISQRLADYYCRSYEREISRFKNLPTEYVARLYRTFRQPKYLKRDCFIEIMWVDFEFLKIPVPKNYTEVLDKQYRNWQTPLQVSTSHGEVYFDVNKSYNQYLKS